MNVHGKKSIFGSIWRGVHANPVVAVRVDVLCCDRSIWCWKGEFGSEDTDESIPVAGEVGVCGTVQEGHLVDFFAELSQR
jgi:hypothetical protein